MNFVTGGTGLLGSHLLFDLASREDEITAMYRSEDRIENVRKLFQYYAPDSWQAKYNKIKWVKGDVLDIVLLESLIPVNSHVYHCAAMVSFDNKDFSDLIHVNRTGTENIVNICLSKGIKKFCHVSSTAAIGGEDVSVNENTKWKNTPETTGYAISKYNAEREVWRGIEEGLNAVIINPCVILGPGNWKESSLTIFKTLKSGMRHYPPGSNATVDARDVASAMIALMNSDIRSERYLCIGSNQTFKELMTEIADQLGVKPPTKEAKKWQVNFARRLLGFVSFFTRKRPSINKDTVSNLFGIKEYSNEKIKAALNIEFRPLKEQVRNAIEGRLN